MKVKLCFGLFGCGEIIENNSCICGNRVHRGFPFKEEFMRECGTLPSVKVFERAYKNIFNRHAGMLDIEHYQKKHLGINITDQKEKEVLKDPYLDKFRRSGSKS